LLSTAGSRLSINDLEAADITKYKTDKFAAIKVKIVDKLMDVAAGYG
jgi:hypothetical protein